VLVAESVTVKTALVAPAFPSVIATSLTARVGAIAASSLVMVPTPCGSAIVALVGLLRLTKKPSVADARVAEIATVTRCVVEPGAKAAVPLAAV
jgi:hypothetical protein